MISTLNFYQVLTSIHYVFTSSIDNFLLWWPSLTSIHVLCTFLFLKTVSSFFKTDIHQDIPGFIFITKHLYNCHTALNFDFVYYITFYRVFWNHPLKIWRLFILPFCEDHNLPRVSILNLNLHIHIGSLDFCFNLTYFPMFRIPI